MTDQEYFEAEMAIPCDDFKSLEIGQLKAEVTTLKIERRVDHQALLDLTHAVAVMEYKMSNAIAHASGVKVGW